MDSHLRTEPIADVGMPVELDEQRGQLGEDDGPGEHDVVQLEGRLLRGERRSIRCPGGEHAGQPIRRERARRGVLMPFHLGGERGEDAVPGLQCGVKARARHRDRQPGEPEDDSPVVCHQLRQLRSRPEPEHVSADPLDREQLQLGRDCELTLPGPSGEIGLDRPGKTRQVAGQRLAGEAGHHQLLARAMRGPVEHRENPGSAEELLDGSWEGPLALHLVLVEPAVTHLGPRDEGSGRSEDVRTKHGAVALGALVDEAEHVLHERQGLAEKRQSVRSWRQGFARGHGASGRSVPAGCCTRQAPSASPRRLPIRSSTSGESTAPGAISARRTRRGRAGRTSIPTRLPSSTSCSTA